MAWGVSGVARGGTIDEVGIWDRRLRVEEISSLYNGGTQGSVPEPPTMPAFLLGSRLLTKKDIIKTKKILIKS